MERNPLRYVDVRTSRVFHPKLITNEPLDTDRAGLLQYLLSKKFISASTTEKASKEYSDFHQLL